MHTGGENICMSFNLCYVHMLVLRKKAVVMQVMYNIKWGFTALCSPQFIVDIK
jgi:hypothetical protein